MKSLYEILELNQNATPTEIRKAYFRLTRKYHPDKNAEPDAVEKTKEIIEAYKILSDPDKRAAYDQPEYASPSTYYQKQEDIINELYTNKISRRYPNPHDYIAVILKANSEIIQNGIKRGWFREEVALHLEKISAETRGVLMKDQGYTDQQKTAALNQLAELSKQILQTAPEKPEPVKPTSKLDKFKSHFKKAFKNDNAREPESNKPDPGYKK